ncbi:ATP-binding cassette domain-containing protein [Pararhodospirillum oryzae]|uniref:ABC transporter n=1 Tax=Pararhodospirillum oryzae TaxID=478448 RepID=A0A512H3I4_9PROT|nr:ATP-binding cassette domain-containing protein [Pararhodospirillum oryzae]GEO80022.1 ABC transporter [Pararhodospirillum oryzae]
MIDRVLDLGVAEIAGRHPSLAGFLAGLGAWDDDPEQPFAGWLAAVEDARLFDMGMERAQVTAHVGALLRQVTQWQNAPAPVIHALCVRGGRDKAGRPETLDLILRPGDVVCLVGPTGAGKSRLLADIECLAQGDTPSGRHVLVNGAPPDPALRFASPRTLIAQVSQTMSFVVDLGVGAFITMHAECRMVPDVEARVREVIACANALAGEPFTPETALTQLSGGQSRALMIADTALLSASPVVLIDEIENAGIDRQKALDLLVARDKIVLISTHDPLLALLGGRRLVIQQGAVAAVIETSERERTCLAALAQVDQGLMGLRERLRHGGRIEALPAWPAPP